MPVTRAELRAENEKLRADADFQASLYRDAAAARDKHFARVRELEVQYGCLKIQERAALKERDTALLQVREQQDIVEAAVELVKWHGAGALNGERYSRLFSLAGNFLLGRTGKRVCVCRPMTYQEGLDGNCIKCKLPIKRKDECAACQGRGQLNIGEPHGVVTCALCEGKGKIS